MSITRRTLLKTGLGIGQLALLQRFGLGSARAQASGSGPTKLLSIYLQGGLHHELMWSPFSAAGITRFIRQPDGNAIYAPSQVSNFDGSGDADADGPIRRLRGPIYWNPASPSDSGLSHQTNPANGRPYTSTGYAFASPDYRLFDKVSLVHGIDQGTAAHQSGVVASLCGVAGGDFRAPAIQAVAANYLLSRFPDRPLANVTIKGTVNPSAFNLPSPAAPVLLGSTGDLEYSISDRRDSAWQGLRTRRDIPDLAFDGTAQAGAHLPATIVEDNVLRAIRGERRRSSHGTDTALEQLHDAYRGLSKTLAKDIVSTVTRTPGIEHLPAALPWAPSEAQLGWRIGYADAVTSGAEWMEDFDLALRLLKSDTTSCVTFKCLGLGNFNFDTHSANPFIPHSDNLHGALEVVGRLLIEMSLTPTSAGRTLLDDTLVVVFSEFGRTFPMSGGSDHNPYTSLLLAGGGIRGNRMIGGYDETAPSPIGLPLSIQEESGALASRPPRAADAASTVLALLGLQPGTDYFIPGGYGEIQGLRA
ncbi:MAG: DUF1501 domain-containing protein [Myxococcota bacterium]